MQLASGASFSNAGNLSLNGALVTGAGSLTNAAAGTLAGPGSITVASFVDQGSLVPGSGTLYVQANWTNNGLQQPGGSLSSVTGGQLTNGLGTIQGSGSVCARVVNTGNGSFTNAGQLTGWGNVPTSIDNSVQVQLAGGDSIVQGWIQGRTGSLRAVSGNSTLTVTGGADIASGAELRVSAGSLATFFGQVYQRTGSVFSGTGTKFYEGGLTVCASPGLGLDAGDVNFGSGSQYLVEIGSSTACTTECATDDALKNTSFDKYIVNGHLALGGTLKLVSWNGYVGQVGTQFDLLDWGSESGRVAAIDASGVQLAPDTVLDFSQLYLNGTVSVQAFHEAQTWALMLDGLGLLGGLARRRHLRGLP